MTHNITCTSTRSGSTMYPTSAPPASTYIEIAMLRVLRRAAPVVLPTLILGSCLTDPAPSPTDTGIPWELAEVRQRTLSNLSYDVSLVIPSQRERPVEGETVVRFSWNDASRRDVVLDFLEPAARVRSVTANGNLVDWRPENDHLVIPQGGLRSGEENEVRIVYSAGDEALNRSDDFLYALFVPDRHHFSLPVFDQPNLKARWRLTLELPEGWVAVGNGAEETVDVEDTDDVASRRRIYDFAETPPISPYLFAFAAGRFEVEASEKDGRRIRMFHRETDPARVARNRDQVFELHQGALAWLEDYTGIPYPFEKFDFVLIPSLQYGGMEHPGAVLYRQDGILLDESATQTDYLDRASTIAHETAHMWFGDLVTMNWFDDVWTKEVFANIMAAEIVHPSFPSADHDVRFLVSHVPAAYAVDRTAGTNAIRQPLDNLRNAGSLYGPIIYDKAPVVMRHLEELVGEEGFRDGLREYLSTYSYGNATWEDLIEILDGRTASDLEAWSRVWVDEPGRPTVSVSREAADAGTLVTISAVDPAGRGRVWPQRLVVAIPGSEGTVFRAVELTGARTAFELNGDEPAWILPNGGAVEYGKFVLDDVSRVALLSGVSDIPEGRVRGAAWVTLWDAVLDGEIPPERFLERLLTSLPKEPDEQVSQLLLGYLRTTYWRLLPSVERGRRGPGVELVLWRGAGEAASETLRAAYFSAWRDIVESSEGSERMKRIWEGSEVSPVPLAETDRSRMAATLAVLEVEGWRQILEQEGSAIINPDRRARFAFLRPALSADPADRERFFSALAEPSGRQREPWVLEGLSYLSHPLRADHARRFIEPALELLEEVQRTGDIFFPGAWTQATLAGHTQPEAAETVRDFLAAHPDYPGQLRGKIMQASDMVERSARIVYGWGG